MTIVRVLTVTALLFALYCGLAFEAVAGDRTLRPHAPAVALILAAWSLPFTPGVFVGAATGLCCDAIGTGPLGPAMAAGALAVAIGSFLRTKCELESPLAAALFGMALASGFLAGPFVATRLLSEVPLPATTLHLHLARAISSAMAATALIVAIRLGGRLLKGLTGVLLNV